MPLAYTWFYQLQGKCFFFYFFFPKQKTWHLKKIPDKADEGKEGDDEGPFVYGLDADCAEDDEAQLEGGLDGTDVTEGEIGFSHNNQLQSYSSRVHILLKGYFIQFLQKKRKGATGTFQKNIRQEIKTKSS